MADIRNISLTKIAQSANISTASVTTNVNLPSVVANIPDVATLGITVETDIRVNVDLAGYGEESISQSGLIKYAQDLVVNIDLARKDISKTLIDTIANTEILSNYVTTIKSDTTAIVDAFSRVVYYIRTFEDIVDATDDFYGVANIDDDQTAYIQKRVNETSTVIEELSKSFDKRLNESFTRFEIIDKVALLLKLETTNTLETINKDVSRVLSDTFERVDTVFKSFNKSALDSVSYSDLNNFSIGKNVIEVTSTIETRAIAFAKVLSDISTSSEIINRSFEKIVLDNFSNTDEKILLFNKTATESTATNELFRVTTNKVFSDTASIFETFSRVFIVIREFLENLYISEIFAKSIFKVTDELLNITELISSAVNPNKVETLYTTEITSAVTNKVLVDLVNSTDDFYGLANVDDDQTARIDKVVIDSGILTELFSTVTTFIRSFTDVASISDELVKTISKIFLDQINHSDVVTKSYEKVSTETVSSSQALSINIQSYFESDYVELGYTGQNYTY